MIGRVEGLADEQGLQGACQSDGGNGGAELDGLCSFESMVGNDEQGIGSTVGQRGGGVGL